jgi:hypothetical protein
VTSGDLYELQPRFTALFDGLRVAFGTGNGEWIKRPPQPEDWLKHLRGDGPGMGIAPLRADSTVRFAAIDLDEPDFAAARDMQQYIPGTSWIESSRSGNAHVWVFFSDAIEAWIPMGILKEAVVAAGKKGVEVFPKNPDFTRVKLGNYINLPWHGDRRPIQMQGAEHEGDWYDLATELPMFLDDAEASMNDPRDWRKRASWMMLTDPREARAERTDFGQQENLHICAEHVIEHAEDNPVLDGHRNAVYFALAKQLTNWRLVNHDEALDILRSVSEASPDKAPDSELRRILANAERGQYTSTGCDDPLFLPYAHPNCPIAHPRS